MRCGASLIACFLPCAAFAQGEVSVHANYATYAAGAHVAEAEAGFTFSPRTYQMSLGFHTTGVIGFFFRGHQYDVVDGAWRGTRAAPSRFVGEGAWHGVDRHVEIAYQAGKPTIRRLLPPNDAEREPVPEPLQLNTTDTLSALAELIQVVDATGRCEDVAHTYDGRRALAIEAHTAGQEILEPTPRSSFAGKALRCDFAGRMQAGFLFGDNRERDSKPLRGSAWLASVTEGGPKLPVRMPFETRWFGDATMYLTATGPDPSLTLARGN
jgi:Protein of unknown function (DUF3108)